MGLIALYKSLSPLTVRQRFRYISLAWKKFQQTRRPLKETELREILAEVLNEFDVILRAVGGLTIAWAEADMFLDYINGILALNPVLATKQPPNTTASLERKTDFLWYGFRKIPELAALNEKVPELIAELKRIQTIRNDVVHGVAAERSPVGARKVMRLKTKGRYLDQTYKTYQVAEISYAAVDTIQLRNKLITLFADSFRILDPERGKQFLSELPSFSTQTTSVTASSDQGDQKGRQRSIPRSIIIYSVVNAVVGVAIGGASVSWLNMLLASLIWGFAIWLLVTLVAGRASKGTALFFSSPTITRLIVWWPISSAASLMIGSLAYVVRRRYL